MKKYSLLIIVLFFQQLYAQHGLQTATQSDWIAAYQYQPALLGTDSTLQSVKLGVSASYFIQNNAINLNSITANGDNYLDSVTKTNLVKQLKSPTSFEQGQNYRFQAAFATKSLPILVNVVYQNNIFGTVNNPQSVELGLFGNTRFQGKTVSDKDLQAGMQTYFETSIGTAYRWKRFSVGGNIKYLAGTNALQLADLDYNFYTAKEGDTLKLDMNYDVRRSKGEKMVLGNGLGVDLGMSYQFKKGTLSASILNVGSIKWNGLRYNNSVNVDYVGFEIKDFNNLINNGIGSVADNIGKDTVINTLIPDSSKTTFNTALPTTANLYFSYPINLKHSIFVSAHAGFNSQAANYKKPLLNVGYQYRFCPFALAGINVYAGGLAKYGVGLLVRSDVKIKSQRLSIIATADNLMGLIKGKALSAQGGLQYTF